MEPAEAGKSISDQSGTNRDLILESCGLGKKFAKSLGQTLRYGISDIAREFLLADEPSNTLRPGEFWAVEDVSFGVKQGEALAIIGRNGSGKSTLLKLLNGLLKPDTGEIKIRGRMAALIELGAGFDSLLSGRENVYINASILGLSRDAVDDLMPAIIEFSGLRDFMETPVKFYSSGMRARLAYSIATNLSPDIFLVDEVLAVGDADFRRKCLRNMVNFVENGGSLIFVSHMAHQIQNVCSRGIVLDSGKIVCAGTALEALDHYYQSDLRLPAAAVADFGTKQPSDCIIESVEIKGPHDSDSIKTGDSISIVVVADFNREADSVAVISILARDLLTVIANESSGTPIRCGSGRHVFRFNIPSVPLMPGLFHVRAAVREGERLLPLATFGVWESPASFLVTGEPNVQNVGGRVRGQLIRIQGTWA